MKRLLGVVIVLQVVQLVGQWTGAPRLETANAQVPDSNQIRLATLDEVKTLNAKMDKLIDLLESGHVQVTVTDGKSK